MAGINKNTFILRGQSGTISLHQR